MYYHDKKITLIYIYIYIFLQQLFIKLIFKKKKKKKKKRIIYSFISNELL